MAEAYELEFGTLSRSPTDPTRSVVMVTNYLLKTGWEIVMTPVTYKVVAFLKRKENEDYYDRDTNFTPFSLKT